MLVRVLPRLPLDRDDLRRSLTPVRLRHQLVQRHALARQQSIQRLRPGRRKIEAPYFQRAVIQQIVSLRQIDQLRDPLPPCLLNGIASRLRNLGRGCYGGNRIHGPT